MDPRIPLTHVTTSVNSASLRLFKFGDTVIFSGFLYDLLDRASDAYCEADDSTIRARCITDGRLDLKMLRLILDPTSAASSVPDLGNSYRDPETHKADLVAYISSPVKTDVGGGQKALQKRDDMEFPPRFADDEESKSRWTLLYNTLDQQREARLERTRSSTSLYLVCRGEREGPYPLFCYGSGLMERADLHPYMVRILEEMQEQDDSYNIITVDLDKWSEGVELEGSPHSEGDCEECEEGDQGSG